MRIESISVKTVLVIGGAGYIGSHMANLLIKNNYHVIIFDNFSTGHHKDIPGCHYVMGDINQPADIANVFATYPIDAVMHFASFIQVGESVQHPAKYYLNNLAGSLNVLAEMEKADIQLFIFSSTAAVYGHPDYSPIDESHHLAPINPYGKSKWMVEEILKDFSQSYGLKYAVLRYFNAAGADPEQVLLGECHEPETHLIPLLLKVAAGDLPALVINGDDYDTADGTCIRDYIHINDICAGHLAALQYLQHHSENVVANLGTGTGHSILEVITAIKAITGKTLPITFGPKRPGDPALLVANADHAKRLLGWTPQYSSLNNIIRDAWHFVNQA